VDDEAARADWDWGPKYGLESMTDDMLAHLREGEKESGSVGT
jgi:nucleoside-diphosphate-sugar epimerase